MYLGTRTGEPPWEYVRYQLRMMYHLSPSQFEREAKGKYLMEMLRDLRCMAAEAKVGKFRLDLMGK